MTATETLAIIMATDSDFETCRRSMEYLARLEDIERVELIIVCRSRDQLQPDATLLARFPCVRIVASPAASTSGELLAAGIREAQSAYVMYAEEHDFVPPETARMVLDRMRLGIDALGLAMLPANPGLVAWAHLYGQFGHAAAPIASGPTDRLGGHHAAYRKDLLLGYDNDLERLMDNEAVLHELLRQRGARIEMCGEVAVPHAQVSNFAVYLRHEYLSQRIYAACRVQRLHWSPLRRAVYVLGSPLIPLLRLHRSVHHIVRSGRTRQLLPKILPVLLAGNVAGAIGEALGYVVGDSQAARLSRTEIELDRYGFVNASDRLGARMPQAIDEKR